MFFGIPATEQEGVHPGKYGPEKQKNGEFMGVEHLVDNEMSIKNEQVN